MKNQFFGFHLDFVGFSASMLCAVHCAFLPVLVSFAPLTGLGFLDNPWIEYMIILFSFFIAAFALIHGYRRHHQHPLPLILVSVGFLLIAAGHLSPTEGGEILLTAIGGTTIAIAHFINWRIIRKSPNAFTHILKKS